MTAARATDCRDPIDADGAAALVDQSDDRIDSGVKSPDRFICAIQKARLDRGNSARDGRRLSSVSCNLQEPWHLQGTKTHDRVLQLMLRHPCQRESAVWTETDGDHFNGSSRYQQYRRNHRSDEK